MAPSRLLACGRPPCLAPPRQSFLTALAAGIAAPNGFAPVPFFFSGRTRKGGHGDPPLQNWMGPGWWVVGAGPRACPIPLPANSLRSLRPLRCMTAVGGASLPSGEHRLESLILWRKPARGLEGGRGCGLWHAFVHRGFLMQARRERMLCHEDVKRSVCGPSERGVGVGSQPRHSFPSRLAIVCGAKSVPKPTALGALPSRFSS